MKKNKWDSIIGCTGIFGSKGFLYVKLHLKAYKIPRMESNFPQYMIMGIKDKEIIISPDGLFCSTFPKKFTKIV